MLTAIGKALVGTSKIVGTLIWMTPSLAIQKRRAIAVFQAELRTYGLDKETIQELTRTYKQMGEVRHWVNNINGVD